MRGQHFRLVYTFKLLSFFFICILSLLYFSVTEGRLQGDEYGYYPNRAGIIQLTVEIPENLACDKCVLQWKYVTGKFL